MGAIQCYSCSLLQLFTSTSLISHFSRSRPRHCDPMGVYLFIHFIDKIKKPALVDTVEDVGWYVTLVILTTCIHGDIHTHDITNLFKQCYIPPMPKHTCMRATHSFGHFQIPRPLMSNKRKIGKHAHTYMHACMHATHSPNHYQIPHMLKLNRRKLRSHHQPVIPT